MTTASDIFACKHCGACCTGAGETYLTLLEAAAIARFLQVDEQGFTQKYCVVSSGRLALAQGQGGTCIFWDQRCTIHDVKPRMCRQWPFLAFVLRNPANWDVVASVCPGMARGVPPETVEAVTRQELAQY